jgi:hypothetical protein
MRSGPRERLPRELAPEPCPCEADVVPDRVHGPRQCRRGLFGRHPAEVVHFDHLRERAIFTFECLQRAVQVQKRHQFPGFVRSHLDVRLPGNVRVTSTALGGGVRAYICLFSGLIR